MESEERKSMEHKERTLAGATKMGWFCSYTPLEVMYAAGFLPQLVSGHSDNIKKADGYMHPNMCQYVRACLDTALEGGYDHLDGAVFVNSCDAMRRLYDAWNKYVKPNFTFILDLPKGRTDADRNYFRGEIVKLKTALEEHYSIEITDSNIKQASKVLGESRSLYHELNELRKETPPRVSGKELMQMATLFYTVKPDAWNQTARALLDKKKNEEPAASDKSRVLISGSPIHNAEIIGMIEDCGFHVVYEDVCTGSRFFDTKVENKVDALADLSEAYLNRPPCSRMMMLDERVQGMIDTVKEFKADGVIHHSLKFCDTYLYDVPEVKKRLTAAGIKTLFVEGDCTLGSFGQLKTRFEAFAEVLDEG